MKDTSLGWWLPIGLVLGILFWGAVALEGVHPIVG
jgi:hypothetical protein